MNGRQAITNKYPATCRRCGRRVESGDGLSFRCGQFWETNHVACPPPEEPRGLPAEAALARAGLDRFAERDPDEGDRG